MKIGWVTPTVGCFGAVREMIEVSNVLVERGHQVTIFSPEGGRCTWLESKTAYGPLDSVDQEGLDALIGIVDWKPVLYTVIRDSEAPFRAVCLMGFSPSEELAAILRGEVPTSSQALRIMREAILDPTMHLLADGQWQLDWVRENVRDDDHIGVAFGGVNVQMFHPRPGARRNGDFRIGASGDTRARKGSDIVEQAVGIIQKMARVEYSTYWGKRYSQERLVEWYQDQDIFLDGHRRGGWCNPVVEAMACGCAVVCTNIGATSAVAIDGETARVVPVDDPQAMAEAALWLLGSQERLDKMAQRGVARARSFDYRHVVPELEAYIERYV